MVKKHGFFMEMYLILLWNIPITTFMIARDAYLQHFVREFAKANNGKAFYTGLDNLGEMIFEDYESNRKRKI